MRECDRVAIEKLHIPGVVLMENAGSSAAEIIVSNFGPVYGKSIVVFCGKGNNGGDGFVAARHLLNAGARVTVVLLGGKRSVKGDPKAVFRILTNVQKKLVDKTLLRVVELASKRGLDQLPEGEILIDAIFGTGFSGDVTGLARDAIEWINNRPARRISLDVPSGISCDEGSIGTVAIRADQTITMCLRKVGLYTGAGRSYTGSIEVASIGFEPSQYSFLRPKTFLVEESDIRKSLPHRPFNAHKHSVGKVLVLAGSRGMTGAAAMSAAAAMRAGAGSVVLGAPASVYPILARKLTEVMVEPLPETSDGSLSLSSLEAVERHLKWADVLILGPGLSRNEETLHLVRTIVAETHHPLLLDADALNAFEGNLSLLRRRKSREVILTPHTGELARLTGSRAVEIDRDRVSVARTVARKLRLTLVLKGAPTVTASDTEAVYVNSTGNPGMATAGSGDVLAGVIGAFWAQGLNRTKAAFCGVYVHGKAGDLAKAELGERGMMAMDITRHLPEALE